MAIIHELSRRLEELKPGILVGYTPTLPNKKIEQELGGIYAKSAVRGSYYRAPETKALISLILKAKERGANAIVELHRECAAYDQIRKIQWQAKTIRLAGKSVKTGNITSSAGTGPNTEKKLNGKINHQPIMIPFETHRLFLDFFP